MLPDRRLVVLALGTFHAVLLLLLIVLLGFLSGALSNVLANEGTAGGLALGGWLWLLSGGATAWTLRGIDIGARPFPAGHVLRRASLAGGLAGAGFAWAVVGGAALRGAWFTLVLLGMGGFVVGTVVGLLLTLADASLLACARWCAARP